MTTLEDKTIIVTGAASGVGEAAARLMAQAGAKVVLADVNAAAGAKLEREISDAGGQAVFVATDVSDEAAVRAMVDTATTRFGRLDGAFNNGAIPQRAQLLHELPIEAWQRNLAVNLTGVFLCMKYELTAMLETGGGAIVNTASIAGMRAFPAAPEYCAAKHGVVGLTRNAALDYGPKNIRVNVLAPGAVRTPMLVDTVLDVHPGAEEQIAAATPLRRLSAPEEQARAALWLLSDEASYLTGAVIPVDGGHTAK